MTLDHVSAARQLGYDYLPGLLELLRSDAKHDPSAASTLDVHWVLYDRVLDVTRTTADDPDRDRFCSRRDTGRPPTTPCSPPRASSRSSRWPTSGASTRRSGTIRTAR